MKLGPVDTRIVIQIRKEATVSLMAPLSLWSFLFSHSIVRIFGKKV